MASGRARLPPTPGTVTSVSTASCARPTLTELHTNNNLYHSSAVPGDGAVPAPVEYQQHPMHHSSHSSQPARLQAGTGGGASHHHHQLHHQQQQEVGMTAGATTSQMLPDAALGLGHGVTQSLRKPFDAPRHIPERPSQLADESDWMSDYADSNLKRRSSISKDYLPAGAATTTTDWLKKSIRRSWTISNAEDDNGSTRDPDVQPYPNPHLPRKQSQSSYPSLVKHPYFNPLSMADEDEYGEEEEERHGGLEVAGGNHRPSALRRAMPPRQSTLPNPEGIYYGSNNNLMPPVSVSPKQQLSPSPQYNTSPYHTDNEADNETGSDHRSPLAARYKIRRQSTLPCKPNEMLIDGGSVVGAGPPHGSGPKIMMSSSPNSRTNLYSKSPERDGIEAASKQQQRFPPFVRQSTFPSNTNDPFLLQIQSHSSPSSSSLSTQPLQSQQQQQQQQQQSIVPTVGQQRQLPTSPNRLVFNKSPDSGTESGPGASESSGTSPHQVGTRAGARNYTMTRQATLPNPEQHIKLLPTSPPKKQLSPHSIKRSPDFARQNTLPASQQQQTAPPQQPPLAAPQSAPVLIPTALTASSCSSLAGTDGAGTGQAVTMNSLSVHQHGPKFMPISPRQKASFLFPQPAAPTPRPFHSQQHFPTHLNTSPSASAVSSGVTSAGPVPGIGVSHSSSTSLSSAVTSKMIKVRSHSNEEYTMTPATRAGLGMGTVSEGRRMLPEIPTGGGTGPGGSRSPRLVRQEHVRDELLIGCVNSVAGQGPGSDKRTTTSSSSSPKQKTFAEAKQTMVATTMAEDMMGYELYGSGGQHSAAGVGYEEFYDEDQELSLDPIETGVGYQDSDDSRGNEQFNLLQMQQQQQMQQQRLPFVPNDSSPDSLSGTQGAGYGLAANRKDRLRSRRKSRDVYDQQDEMSGVGIVDASDGVGLVVATVEPVKRKPETMRSISEEAPAAKPPKPVTRRSLSHPEKDTQVYSSKKLDSSKIPSPKPLTELQDRQHKPSAAIGSSTSPRRKNIKSFDCGTVSSKGSNLQPGTYTQYQTSDGSSGGGPTAVSPGIVTESSCSSNTRTSGYGGSATTLAGTVPAGPTASGGPMAGFQSFGQRKISAFQQILQRQRLQKRDSKSLDIVASKLMEEKYGNRGQDVDVSKSLDDGIFSESAGHQSDDNSSDEHINLTYKASKDNKTTLGEAEIQNAVEAAAVIFKKVVLQRREENKCKSSNANHECHSSADGLTDESATLGGYSSSETEAVGRMQSFGQSVPTRAMPPDYEEYRLVFFSSDSSSKEEEYDSSSTSSSSAMRHAKRHRYTTTSASLDECDWDYFEPDMMPGADETKSAFFYEMLAMATATAQCVGSAHNQCKNTSSASKVNNTSSGRKLDNRAEPSSTFCHCECCNRRQMQYVPIPVPVPVPVPIAAFQSWLYEQQQQMLLMHGATDAAVEGSSAGGSSASDYALRTDLVQQLWKKFADSSSETSVRNAPTETETVAAGGGNRKVPPHPKCACRFGSYSRRDVFKTCATSESHDSSDNERNATKVRTCKHLNVRHKSGVESERGYGAAGRGSSSGSSGSEATAACSRVHVQKATTTPSAATSPPPPQPPPSSSSSLYSVMRRDSVGGVASTSSDHGDVRSSYAGATAPTALQLVQSAVVVPPLRTGEFPLAVPVTTSAANDIVTTAATSPSSAAAAKPIQAQDNIVTGAEAKTTANGRVQTREFMPDSNVRASVAATSSLPATGDSVTVETGLNTASAMDDDDQWQRQLCSSDSNDGGTDSTGSARTNDIDLRAKQQRGEASQCSEASDTDGNVNSDNKCTDTDNKTVVDVEITLPPSSETVVKAADENNPHRVPAAATAATASLQGEAIERQEQAGSSSEMRKSSKNRTDSADEPQDGYLQYELLYHLAQTGGRSSPSSSSASSSEAENAGPVGPQQDRKAKVGKYSFHLTESSDGKSSYSSSRSSSRSASSLQEKCSSSSDTDPGEDYFDRDHATDTEQEDGDDDDDDDGCCFDGDDDEVVAGLPRGGARRSGKRFNAVMVINPGHSGSDGEGPSDSDSSDNQSIRTEGEHSSYYGEVAGFPPFGGYDGDADAGGVIVLKRVKNISDFEETEGGNEHQRSKPIDDKLVQKCAEVSIEQSPPHNESTVGRQLLEQREAGEAAVTTTAVDHPSNVKCTTVKGGSRKSGEIDSSPQPNREQPALVDPCYANIGESNTHHHQQQQQQLEEKGTVSRCAPGALSYAPDADCQQQEYGQQQQRYGSIKVEEKPQHHHHDQHYHNDELTLLHTGNGISSVTGVYRVRTPPPPSTALGTNAATCVSNAVDECVSGATTTTTTESGALGDIRSPQTPHTVVDTAVLSSSTIKGGSGNKYKSLVMITDDTSDANSSNDHESRSVAAPNISSEGVVANVVQVTVASSSPTTTTTTVKTVPSSSAEDIVCVQSHDHDEITLGHIQHSPVASDDRYAVAQTLCSLQSLPECLPEQSRTGRVVSGARQQQHGHEHTSIAAVSSGADDDDRDAAGGCSDQKSSTEEYEKNPTLDAAGALIDLCNRHSPSVRPIPVMEGEHFQSEHDVQMNSVDRSSDCDDFYQPIGGADGVGENQQSGRVPKAAGEKLGQPVGLQSADETNQVYGNEMERYDENDDGGGADDGRGGMQTQIGNVTANENVTVTTGSTTLSAVICLEDGLADDDSWVEEISQDEEEFATTTATDSDLDDSSEEMSFSNDREEELRGYNRTAIDFTLHTIVEESCEDSEIESRGSDVQGRRRGRRNGRGVDHGFEVGHDGDGDDGSRDPAHRLSASELEKYFFYGLGGDGGTSSKVGGSTAGGGAESYGGTGYGVGMHDDQSEMSEESSSLCSDGHDSLGSGTASGSASAARLSGASMESHDQDNEDNSTDSVTDLASSRLEKYFLTGFLGYNSTDRGSGGGGNGGGGNGSDGSGGSVGSDSEGHVSPEQRRKRLVRARGATRSHSSLDNLLLAGKDAEHNHESIGSNISQSASSSYDAAGMIAGGSGTGSAGVMGGNGDLDHSSETDTCDESSALYSHQDRSESSPYDTMGKRKKKFMTKKMDVAMARAEQQQQQHHGVIGDASLGGICSESEDSRKTPLLQSTTLDMASGREAGVAPGVISSSLHPPGIENSRKQTSRDSGFIGSNDDLLKEDQTVASSSKAMPFSTVEPILEENRNEHKESDAGLTDTNQTPSGNTSRLPISPGSSSMTKSSPQGTGMVNLVRKDSFNNWSSDEETNLMMSKMRQFFKSLVAASANTRKLPNSSSSTPGVSGSNTPQQGGSTPVARPRGMRTKPPQLVYFENELTRLMKTVPGIRDEQVREIVEYLSSEDTWSDSYDSSDYTSSDLEGTAAAVAEGNPFGLQEEISASCRQIINKFDSSVRKDEEGDIGDGGLVALAMSEKAESPLVAHHRHHHLHQPHPQQQQQSYHQTPLSKETAFVYQRLVASLSKVVSNEAPGKETNDPSVDLQPNASGVAVAPSANSSSSPPLIAKVMHHIGSRLVALMHEVSSGESHASISPKPHRIGMHRKSGQTMPGNVGSGVNIGAAGGNTATGIGAMLGHHHHHHHHHLHHHHQIISATTTEDDEDSSTSESNDRQHPHHYHHHRSRIGAGATAPETAPPAGQEEDEEVGAIDGGTSVSASSYAMLLPRSKSHDLLLSDQRSQGHYQYHSGTGSDMVGEERGEASDYERFSWRGSFESALLANGDSRTKLSMLDNSSSSKSILVAKRRSAGDLLFNNQNLSQEQLDRVRSCGSIGGDREELWEEKQQQPHQYHQNQPYHNSQQPHQQQLLQQQHHQPYPQSSTAGSRRRLSSVAADEEDTDSDEGVMKGGSNRLVLASRSTLPRSLQNTMTSGTTNSLPRLPTSNLQTIMQSVASSSASSSSGTGSLAISSTAKPTAVGTGGMAMGQKSQSVYHFLQNNVKSARYRAPGFNRPPSAPKRAMSAPGLQPPYPRRERRNRLQHLSNEECNSPDLTGSTGALGGDDEPQGNSTRATARDTYDRQGDGTSSNGMQHKGGSIVSSPVGSAGGVSENWPSQSDEDIDRLVALHQNRASLSSLGVRSDSMASVYSGAGEGRYGTVTVRGQIEFGMQYNYKQGALEIHVKQCKDLAAVDTKRNRSDPYVKVYLLPDKSKSGKRKTKVKKHTLNPVFDEVLRFHMSLNSLQTRTIWITVWHSDMFGRNDFLGEVMMGLQDKVFDNPQAQWYQLQERSEPFEDLSAYKGDIIVGLKYVSADADSGGMIGAGGGVTGGSGGSAGSGFGTLNLRKFSTRSLTSNSSSTLSGHSKGALHVLVKEAKHLQPIKSNGTCDAFCKSYLLPDKNRSSKQKTPVIKRTNSPVWNYTFVYEDVSLAELSERALELTIWDHDRLASNEFLGGVRFSLGNGKHNGRAVEWMDSTGKELSLWQNMINRPNFWVEGALVLRPSLENAKFST